MNKIETDKMWFCADLHFGHKFMLRPNHNGVALRKQGYEERILEAWYDTVGKDDTVFILGDTAFTAVAYWFQRLSEMPGKKVLFIGNHDKNRPDWYTKFNFSMVVPFDNYVIFPLDLWEDGKGVTKYGKVMLSHLPAFASVATPFDAKFRGLMGKFEKAFNNSSCILNIHGHLHGKGAEKHNTMDVTPEVIGEQLVSLAQIIQVKFKNIPNAREQVTINPK